MTMTLELLRDELRMYAGRPEGIHVDPSAFSVWADAIDARLSQPQPVAQGEAVHPVDAVWQALDKVSCPGVYMNIAAEAVASAIDHPIEPPRKVHGAKTGRYFGRVPPRWYTQQEIEHCLQRMSYSEPVIAELAPWFHRHIKSAFDKGYNMALGHATPTIPTGHRVVPVEPTEAMALAAAKSVSGEWDDESADVKVGLVEIQRAAIRDAIAAAPDAGGV